MKTIKNLATKVAVLLVIFGCLAMFAGTAAAIECPETGGCAGGGSGATQDSGGGTPTSGGATDTSTGSGSTSDAACDSVNNSNQLTKCVQNNQIVKDLQTIINFLSVGVGIIVIAMIIVGGIQYSMAGDNAQAVTAAKGRITNALIGLAAYLFIFAFLQWLIPGGIFG